MTAVSTLNLSLLQQLTMYTAGLRAGLPAEPLHQALRDQSEHLPPEAASLLQRIGEDLRYIQEGKSSGSSDIAPLLRELTRAVDHQVRNAHNVATLSLQVGEMQLEDITAVLSAMGDTQGLLALEQVRAQLKTAREGLLRASGFLDVLGALPETSSEAGADFHQAVRRRIADLMNWKPEDPTAPQPATRAPLSFGARVSLLYVEDDLDTGELAALFMERLDFVEAAYRSESYLGALQVFSDHPSVSVLVTDYHLLNLETGLDLARELRRRRTDMKTLITSGSLDVIKLLLTAEEMRDFVLLPKPFGFNDLEARLRETVAGNP